MDSFLSKCVMYQTMLETFSIEDVKNSMITKITNCIDIDTFMDIIEYNTQCDTDHRKIKIVLDLCDMFNYTDINMLIGYLSVYNMNQLISIHDDSKTVHQHVQKFIDETYIIQFRAYIFHNMGYDIKSIVIVSEYEIDHKYIKSFRNLTKVKFDIDSNWILPILAENNTITELILSNNDVVLGYLSNLKHLKKLDIKNTSYMKKLVHRIDTDNYISLFKLAELDELHISYQLSENYTMNAKTCHIYTYEDEHEEGDNCIVNISSNTKKIYVYCKPDVTFDVNNDIGEHSCDIIHITI